MFAQARVVITLLLLNFDSFYRKVSVMRRRTLIWEVVRKGLLFQAQKNGSMQHGYVIYD